ncbi:MAG TPA: tripartite tricarboxylate transporter substrate binding protein [Burkholderiales bacterium]|nr:tripartite tricarboxylate transporter substrate binding protein [Burkholderiales bacterium]
MGFAHATALFVATLLAIPAQAAESYPSRPIRLLVPSPPGGSPDILARITAVKLSEQMKQQVVVDNRAGASGIVGLELAKHAPPDGYTVLFATATTFASLPALKANLPYDVERDFLPLTRIAWVANVMTVNANIGANSVADLVKLAKAKPGQLNYGSAGNGSPAHLAGAMLNVLAGIDTVHVPYKGAAPAMTDLMAGQLQILITSPLVAMPHGRAGRIKVLATTGAKRDPLLPELPPVADTVPGYEIVQWWGYALPARTPRAVAQRLHGEIVTALKNPDVRTALQKNGATAHPESPAEFAAFVKAERERIAKVGKQAKIVID